LGIDRKYNWPTGSVRIILQTIEWNRISSPYSTRLS
jgi:hypothetical protein